MLRSVEVRLSLKRLNPLCFLQVWDCVSAYVCVLVKHALEQKMYCELTWTELATCSLLYSNILSESMMRLEEKNIIRKITELKIEIVMHIIILSIAVTQIFIGAYLRLRWVFLSWSWLIPWPILVTLSRRLRTQPSWSMFRWKKHEGPFGYLSLSTCSSWPGRIPWWSTSNTHSLTHRKRIYTCSNIYKNNYRQIS